MIAGLTPDGQPGHVELRILAPDFFVKTDPVDGHQWWRVLAAHFQFSAGANSEMKIGVQRKFEATTFIRSSSLYQPLGLAPSEAFCVEQEFWVPPGYHVIFVMRPLVGAELADCNLLYQPYATPAAARMLAQRLPNTS